MTERKRSEEALRESEGKFGELFDHAPIGYQEHGGEGRIFNINRTLLEMMGYSFEEMIGQPVWKFVVEGEAQQAILAKLRGTRPPGQGFERTFRRKDGTMFPVLIHERALRSTDGRITGMLSTVQDITERKQGEKVLRESEETAKKLAQENAIMAEIGRIISSTLNIEEVYERFAVEVGKLIPFDRIVINLNDYKNNTILTSYVGGIYVTGRSPGDVIPLSGSVNEQMVRTRSGLLFHVEGEDEIANRFPILAISFRAGFRSMLFVPLISKDEVIGGFNLQTIKPNAYAENDLKLAEKVSNQIVGAIANAQLFSERKRIERALRESEEKLRELYDNAPAGYQEYDSEGRISNINRTQMEMMGYSFQEMIGQPVWKFVVEEEKARETILAKLAGTIPPSQGLERVFRRKDGTTFPVLIRDRVLRDGYSRITGMRSTIQDITDRKQAEEEKAVLQEQLRQSQKMEAVGQLAGGIAHDFNNLLTIIKGYSQLSLFELQEDGPLRRNVAEIEKAANRAADLTRQLLAFSRRQILEMKVLDLNTRLKDLDKMLRRIIGEDIELVTHPGSDLGRVKADPGQIEQVVINLAVNARDAMPTGGKLTIETANVELDEAYALTHIAVIPGRYVMVSVSDTGVGMTPEVRDHVFEPFFTTKETGKGTGLGLSMVYGIVKQSGGNIWVYSEPGKGTTFKIYLPQVNEPLQELREKKGEKELLLGSETILVVEDEKEVRKLALRILERQGYRILAATSGEDALSVCKEHQESIHLLLTDVVMPGMTGRILAESLVSLYPKIKVLYMSGYTENAIVHHGILDPGTNYIQKPFTVDGLITKIREVLDK
jgi:two-component system, cell cycle sensor histidine kinase and response regulator CckA